MGENLITINSVHCYAPKKGLEYGTGYSLLSSDSELGTLHSFPPPPHPPIPPSSSPLSTFHSALPSPLGTRNSELGTDTGLSCEGS
uniref:Uncharacterized protein n=1 Tax=Desertifilum tharense IPPAS B-1220 TaxID=1781255 RepID=A0ACD5GX88_9CYAN